MALAPDNFSRTRVERVIGVSRVVLASTSLFAIWLDPAEPARYAELTYTLHACYVAYALALAALMWRRDSTGRLPLATHVADIVMSSVFQYLTLGPSSPFFVYFVFSLFSAAIRWGWRATVRTAMFVIGSFVVMSVSMSRTLGPTEFELDRSIIRVAYLAVVTALLVYLGQHEARLRDDMRRLALWPRARVDDWSVAVQQFLGYAATVVGASHATLAWSVEDEPWLYVASSPSQPPVIARHAPGDFDPLVPADLADVTYVCDEPILELPPWEVRRGGTPEPWRGLPVHPSLLNLFDGVGLASAPFRTAELTGRVFFSGLLVSGPELIPLLDVVAREIAQSLDQLRASEQSRHLAIAEDRIRLARDLHDGVLQSLTGVRLQLQSVAAAEEEGASALRIGDRLLALERALAVEQRDLRRFIEGLTPTVGASGTGSLAERLEEIRKRIALEWRAAVTIRVSPENLSVPAVIAQVLPLMVHEAVVNALKHAHPSRVSVDVDRVGDALRVVVLDDGGGFPFTGRRDTAALAASNAGPVSLRQRVTVLGGDIVIDSSPSGSRVELSLPLRSPYA